jgi:hypothetical protein
MNNATQLLGCILVVLACACGNRSEAGPEKTQPVFGVMSKGRVFTVVAQEVVGEYRTTYQFTFSKIDKPERHDCPALGQARLIHACATVPIWKVADGQFYTISDRDVFGHWVCFVRLEEFVGKRWATGPTRGPARERLFLKENMTASFPHVKMLADESFARHFAGHDPEYHLDHLPVREGSIRMFFLANFESTPMVKHNPKWRLEVYRCDMKWKKSEDWETTRSWYLEERIEAPLCREGFRVFAKGDDYFFLTHSGKLFCAPKAKEKGKRKMVAVWEDARRPIEAVLAEDPGKKVFFFCGPKAKGSKPCYFQMAGKPELKEYDPAKFPKVKLKGPLGPLVRYARVLEKLEAEPR